MFLSYSTLPRLLRSDSHRPARVARPAGAVPDHLRLIAGFCATREQSLRLHADLSGHLRLQPAQALLLTPADVGSPRLARCLRRWRRLRQASGSAAPPRAVLPVWAGTLACLFAGLAWALLAGAGAGDAVAFGLLAGLLGMAGTVGLRVASGERPSRFDRSVQKQLRQGLFAVVVQEPRGAYTCNYLVASMRDDGLPWCAEVPRRQLVSVPAQTGC